MMNECFSLIQKLDSCHSLTLEEYKALILGQDAETVRELARLAVKRAADHFGKRIFIRGLIEISNFCRNGCYYCGINRDNNACHRYRLSPEQIYACCKEGYALGFRTFVLQGGEDPWFTDENTCEIVETIHRLYPDCAITLSLGERTEESYRNLYQAGARRYLLRHETADYRHYQMLHPPEQMPAHRFACLDALHKIGYQTGCGFMVGAPGQTAETLAKDLKFIETFSPEMCGIGPFIPHSSTIFRGYAPGTAEQTCYLLSIIRVMKPNILLPATTALGTIHPRGRELGILSGANVVMPNLSPEEAKMSYTLYDNKLASGAEAAENLNLLKSLIGSIGYEIVVDPGDFKPDQGESCYV